MRKRGSQGQVSQDERTKARKQLIVLLSALLFVLLPLYPATILIARLAIWLGIGSTLNGSELLIVPIVLLLMYLIGAVISSFIWMFIMSFYLTVEEWDEYEKIPGVHIPIITPVFRVLSHKILTWKISREK